MGLRKEVAADSSKGDNRHAREVSSSRVEEGPVGLPAWEEEGQMPLTALRVRGSYKGPTGYDHHTREFVRELHNQGVAVELIDLPGWGPARLPASMQDPWFDSLNRPAAARVGLHFCMPHHLVPFSGFANVNYTMFEATRIHPMWVAHSLTHDLVVLPTESSKRAWVASGVPEDRIRLCPLGIDSKLFSKPATPLPLRRDNGEPIRDFKVRFLNLSELGPRKNLVGLLRVWLKATSRQDDAILILKLGAYLPGMMDEFRRQVEQLQAQVGKRLDEAAAVHIIRDFYPDGEMPRLYAAATHYFSMSFAEGWDQPMVEAAASGLRLIAPNHSAYPTYLDPSVADLIPSREIPAVFPGGGVIGSLFQNANWWEPDEDAAVGYVQSAIRGKGGGKASPRERILSEFTWERATQRLIAILSEVEVRKKPRVFSLLPRWYRRP